jgi:hypothetical protein
MDCLSQLIPKIKNNIFGPIRISEDPHTDLCFSSPDAFSTMCSLSTRITQFIIISTRTTHEAHSISLVLSLSLVLWAGSTWWTRPRRCRRLCARASSPVLTCSRSPHVTPSPSSSGGKVPPGSSSGSTASSPLHGFVSLLPLLFLIIFSPCEHRSWAAGVMLLAWVREAGVATAGRVPGCGTRRVEARGPALTGYVQAMASSRAQ